MRNGLSISKRGLESYSFGSLIPGRSFSSSDYRYGFNGKESDNEVKGNGNQYDYGFRIYDPRIGRFLSVDPLTKDYPWYTPYQFAGNKPIWASDLDGLEEFFRTDYRDVGGNLYKTEITMVTNNGTEFNKQTVHHTTVTDQGGGVFTKVFTGTTFGTTTGNNAFATPTEQATALNNSGTSVISQQLKQSALKIDNNGNPSVVPTGGKVVIDQSGNPVATTTKTSRPVNNRRLQPVGYETNYQANGVEVGLETNVRPGGRREAAISNPGTQTFNQANTGNAAFNGVAPAVDPSNKNAVPPSSTYSDKAAGGSGNIVQPNDNTNQ